MAYNVNKLKELLDSAGGRGVEWNLRDLLAYGTQEELVTVVLDKALEGHARELAIRVLPIQALLVGIFDRLPLAEMRQPLLVIDKEDSPLSRLRGSTDVVARAERIVAYDEQGKELAVLKARSGPAVTK